VLALYRAGIPPARIAQVTKLNRHRVTQIVRESIAQGFQEAGVEDVRLRLLVDLEELKVALQRRLFFGQEISPTEQIRLANSIVRIIHEQALLAGAHAPKQVTVESGPPVVNEKARQRARDLVEFMDLADQIARSGYGARGPVVNTEQPPALDAEVDCSPDAEGVGGSCDETELLQGFRAKGPGDAGENQPLPLAEAFVV